MVMVQEGPDIGGRIGPVSFTVKARPRAANMVRRYELQSAAETAVPWESPAGGKIPPGIVIPHRRPSCLPVGDEPRARDEDRGRWAERGKSPFGLAHEFVQPCLCARAAKNADDRRLARLRVLAGLLADKRGVAFNVEKIVRDLEGLPDRQSVALERPALRPRRRSENTTRLASEAQQCARLHRLQGPYVALAEAQRPFAGEATLGGEIEHLAAGHTADAGGTRERVDEVDADRGIGMRLWTGQDVEGEGEQTIAGQDRGGLVEGFVGGRLSTPQGIIVHRRQVVVNKRVAMHAFERRARHQGTRARDLDKTRTFHHQEWTETLPATQAGVAHDLDKSRGPFDLALDRSRGQETFEEILDVLCGCVQARDETVILGIHRSSHRSSGVPRGLFGLIFTAR